MKKYISITASLVVGTMLVVPQFAYGNTDAPKKPVQMTSIMPVETAKKFSPSVSRTIAGNYWTELVQYNGKTESTTHDYLLDDVYPSGLLTPEQSRFHWFGRADSNDLTNQVSDGLLQFPSVGINTKANNLTPTSLGNDMFNGYIKLLDPTNVPNIKNGESPIGGYTSINRDFMKKIGIEDENTNYLRGVKDFNIRGDISMNNDTGASSIPEIQENTDATLSFSLNMSLFRRFMNNSALSDVSTVQDANNAQNSWDNPFNSFWKTAYIDSDAEILMTLDLPSEVSVDDNTKYSITGLTGFTVKADKLTNNRLTVHIRKDAGEPQSFVDFYKALNKIENVSLSISNIKIGNAPSDDKTLKITGHAYGMLDTLMSGSKDNFTAKTKNSEDFIRKLMIFSAEQSNEGRDANAEKDKNSNLTKPNLITFSFRVKKPETYSVTYSVTYSFKSGTSEKSLPAEVTALLPATTSGHTNGENITPAQPSKTSVDIKDKDGKKLGTWNFAGWSPTSATINNADVSFVGTWNFTPVTEPKPGPNTPPIPGYPYNPETPEITDTPVTPETPEEESQEEPQKSENKQESSQTEQSNKQQILKKTGVNIAFIAIFAIFIVLSATLMRRIRNNQQIKHLH